LPVLARSFGSLIPMKSKKEPVCKCTATNLQLPKTIILLLRTMQDPMGHNGSQSLMEKKTELGSESTITFPKGLLGRKSNGEGTEAIHDNGARGGMSFSVDILAQYEAEV
jgi:hypothetical protein